MNNARRKELAEITTQLQDLRERIEQLQEDEQEGFDNLSEGLQQTERGQAMELAAVRAKPVREGHFLPTESSRNRP